MSNTNDLISRKAAIEAVNSLTYPSSLVDVKRKLVDLPSAESEPRWIPIKLRPMTEEEKQHFKEHYGEEPLDEEAVVFNCHMPYDRQEILLSYHGGYVCIDQCEVDDNFYGLKGVGDWDGVIAWMPLPEPYKAESDKESEAL